MASKVFRRVGGLLPGRSVFDLSYEKKFTCDMGQLIPVMCDEVVPGDTFQIGNEIVIRFQPLIAPILHEINAYVHYFFVPYRLLWEDWEEFITGGTEGPQVPDTSPVLPRWSPSPGKNAVGSLWDYFGFPVDVVPAGALPLDFPKRAYNFVFAEYYRDQNLQKMDDDEYDTFVETNEDVLIRNWEKDYFTASLPWQQRGVAPALPISGVSSAVFNGAYTTTPLTVNGLYSVTVSPEAGNPNAGNLNKLNQYGNPTPWINNDPIQAYIGPSFIDWLNNNKVTLENLATFNVADLRLAFQIQKWLERNARAGARYTEFLRSHFGVSPRDDRLDRPEYIGGSKSPIIISEVLQTSSSDSTSPQANMAGHGLTADKRFVAKYRVVEYGLIIGIMSVMPRTGYSQGIDRQWLRRTRYDFYFPEFANLSEQAVENAEIVATNDEQYNLGEWGFIPRYDEMRFKRTLICGQMRSLLDYWHLGRKFDLNSPPLLNEDFIKCKPENLKRIFAVQEEPGLVVNFANVIRAVRPMPVLGNPGLIDHH